ncbi:MAG: DUF5596 domain-containing protein [Clostridia bacterium]|nr:DUF5596 domain-containing protein [Clostridia bacterium]
MEKILQLANKINLPDELKDKLSELDMAKIEKLSDKCIIKGFNILRKEKSLLRLGVILNLAVKVKDKYDEANIDEKIYYDTMSDIEIWCRHTNYEGVKNYGWLKNHVSFELFRLGRLQFQLYECKNKTLLYNKLPFSYGDKLIYIHIPEGEKLEREKCDESIIEADAFFKRYFPMYHYKYYFCESWLLCDTNRDFMAENSNILKFMDMFEICYNVKVDVQAIERIFGKRKLFAKNYPENTDLQKRTKAYILGGKNPGIGVGVIRR